MNAFRPLHRKVKSPSLKKRTWKDPELESFMNDLKSKGATVTKSKYYDSDVFIVSRKGFSDRKYMQYEFTSGEKGVMEEVVTQTFSNGYEIKDWKKVRGWKSEKEYLTALYVPTKEEVSDNEDGK